MTYHRPSHTHTDLSLLQLAKSVLVAEYATPLHSVSWPSNEPMHSHMPPSSSTVFAVELVTICRVESVVEARHCQGSGCVEITTWKVIFSSRLDLSAVSVTMPSWFHSI